MWITWTSVSSCKLLPLLAYSLWHALSRIGLSVVTASRLSRPHGVVSETISVATPSHPLLVHTLSPSPCHTLSPSGCQFLLPSPCHTFLAVTPSCPLHHTIPIATLPVATPSRLPHPLALSLSHPPGLPHPLALSLSHPPSQLSHTFWSNNQFLLNLSIFVHLVQLWWWVVRSTHTPSQKHQHAEINSAEQSTAFTKVGNFFVFLPELLGLEPGTSD